MYDSVEAALRDLRDPLVLERVAYYVLRGGIPDLRLTSATADTGKDALGKQMFGAHDDVRVMVSLEGRWTTKLDTEIAKIRAQKPRDRAPRAIFVTNQTATERGKKPRTAAAHRLKVGLEVVDLTWLVSELKTDELHWVAEFELGLRPRAPRPLIGPDEFLSQMGKAIPGFAAPMVGRELELETITRSVADQGATAPRLVVVSGGGGTGKSRLAVEGSRRAATTLVAMPGARIDSAALRDVPLHVPAVVVVDDAHRSADLSGIATMLGDSRYNDVTVVFTLRPGLSDPAVHQAGLDHQRRVEVTLDVLDRGDVAAIVRGHGIDHEQFTVAVINLAQGNPLLAHAACAIAVDTGVFGAGDATGLLRRLAEPLKTPGGEARAVAISLALAGPVDGGEALARFGGVVRLLPGNVTDIDRRLDDIADVGLAVVAPSPYGAGAIFSLRPELVAPVLVADSLNPLDPNRIDIAGALRSVGAGHVPAGSATLGALGLPQLDGHVAAALDVGRVAPHIAVLAQAADIAQDTQLGERLGRAVLDLLPDAATADAWRAVLVLAEQVATGSPGVLDELRNQLARQWPLPAPPPSPFDALLGDRQHHDLRELVQSVEGVVSRVGYVSPRAATRLMLTAAALVAPIVDAPQHGRPRALDAARNAAAWATSRQASLDESMERRGLAIDAIRDWLRDDTDGMVPSAAAHMALTALTRLLKPGAEGQQFGTSEAANAFVFFYSWLPNDTRVRRSVLAAADVVVDIVASVSPSDPESASLLREIVQLPSELVAEGRRGLPGNTTVQTPSHVVATLKQAAARIREAVAARWIDLPLWARQTTAAADSRYGARPPTLARRARDGDPVAAAALVDQELQDLLVLVPADGDGPTDMTGPPWRRHVAARRAAATSLAERLDWPEAVHLLETADRVQSRDFAASEGRAAFADEAGHRAAAAGQALDLLNALAETTSNEWPRQMLLGALGADSTSTTLVDSLVADDRFILLALEVANDLPEDARHNIFAAGLHLGTDPSRRDGGVAPQSSHTTDSTDPGQVAAALARALLRGPDPATDRMDMLLALGEKAPDRVVPAILRFATYAIRLDLRARDGVARDPELVDATPQQAAALVHVLMRRIDKAEARYMLDDDAGRAAVGLAVAAPEELAAALAPRLVGTCLGGRWPLRWGEQWREIPAELRAPFSLALRERVDAALAAAPIDPGTLREVERSVAAVAVGSQQWAADVQSWAEGGAIARGRAAANIARAWRDPVWPSVVARLLTRGLAAAGRQELLSGIDLTTLSPDIADDAKPRFAVLEQLAAASTDAAVAGFVGEATARIKAAVDDYEADARTRQRGYTAG